MPTLSQLPTARTKTKMNFALVSARNRKWAVITTTSRSSTTRSRRMCRVGITGLGQARTRAWIWARYHSVTQLENLSKSILSWFIRTASQPRRWATKHPVTNSIVLSKWQTMSSHGNCHTTDSPTLARPSWTSTWLREGNGAILERIGRTRI